jgi:hypothetical protein
MIAYSPIRSVDRIGAWPHTGVREMPMTDDDEVLATAIDKAADASLRMTESVTP